MSSSRRRGHDREMDSFVRGLMSTAPLSPECEVSLARAARQGDRAARDALITAGLRSVALRARLLGLRGEELRDAVQAGTIGLIRAVDRFDPDRGVRLATYAWHWIGAEMVRDVRREVALDGVETSTCHPSESGADLLEELSAEARDVVELRFGIGPGHPIPLAREAVAQRLGLTISQVRTIEGKAMRQLRGGLAKVADRAPHQ